MFYISLLITILSLLFPIQGFVTRLSSDLHLPNEIVAATLEELRQHAVEKLAARKKYQEDGIAILKVKLTGSIPTHVSKAGFSVETKLEISSSALKQL